MAASLLSSLLFLVSTLNSVVEAEVSDQSVLNVNGVTNWGAPCLIQEPGKSQSFHAEDQLQLY